MYTSHKTIFTAAVSIGYCEAPSEVIARSPRGDASYMQHISLAAGQLQLKPLCVAVN